MSESNPDTVVALRDLLANRLALQWEQFAREHPALAASLDRAQLVESSVARLIDDPRYRRAMELAGQDEAELAASAEVVAVVDAWLRKTLALAI